MSLWPVGLRGNVMKAQCPECGEWRAVFDRHVSACSKCGDAGFNIPFGGDGSGKGPARRNKYNNRRVEADGFGFDSKAEYRRYVQLKTLADAGEIGLLTVHPRFELLAPFTDAYGRKHRGITYEADFSYVDGEGQSVAEDVKGVETAVFKMKRQLFCQKYPAIELRVLKVK